MKKLLTFLLFPFPFLLFPNLCEAQIAINNTAANPDASAILDLKTGNTGVNKGFLPQSVALTNVTTAAPVVSPATGLIVYSSTAPTGGNGTGYYYWNGTAWASLNSTIGGSGTNNYVARWTPNANTLGTGMIRDNGSTVGINGAPANAMLYINSPRAAGDSSIGVTYGGFFKGSAGPGVYSKSSTAAGDSSIGKTYGVYGLSSTKTGFGVIGTNSATGGVGVNAKGDTAITAYGSAYGINAYGASVAIDAVSRNIGILASGTTFGISASGGNYGGEFVSSNGIGVYGDGGSKGGYFIGTKGQGVFSTSNTAAADSSVGLTYGVYSVTSDPTGTHAGVYAVDNNINNGWGLIASGYGGVSASGHIYGISANGGNYGVYGTAPDAGIYGQGENFGGGVGVQGFGYNAAIFSWPLNSGNVFSGTSYGLYATQTTTATTGVAAIYAEDAQTSDNVQVNAWSGATHYKVLGNWAGSVSCAVKDLHGDKVVLHCPETPEFYFEDYGEGQLMNGKAHIDLDPILAKNVAINEKHHLRVFVQLDGDCKGVYVANKTTIGFDVVELDGGTSNTQFEWHIICNVKDENEGGVVNHNEDLRFEKAPVVVKSDIKTIPALKAPSTTVQTQTQDKN